VEEVNASAQVVHPSSTKQIVFDGIDLASWLPPEHRKSLASIEQNYLPQIAKDGNAVASIESALHTFPTRHYFVHGDAREMPEVPSGSAHLIVTSPPYWSLKKYRDSDGQLGHIVDYERFLNELDKVWRRCFDLLVPGGRIVCVVGDVCLSRRQNEGRHTVVPLHASIQESCRQIGFDNLAPIFWHKIANAVYEVPGSGGFLGKPYEPNSVIKNDVEYILMQRKPGGYRKPDIPARILSVIGADKHQRWFQQVWSDIPGESTKRHPAPFPVELAERLVRMFSFAGDVVLDPFSGTGTTALVAANSGRNSISYEIDRHYLRSAGMVPSREEMGSSDRLRRMSDRRNRIQVSGWVVWEQFQQSNGGSPRKREGYLGSVQRRRICAIATTMARLFHAPRRGGRLHAASWRMRTSLQSLPRIQKRVVCTTI
jgi:DNA modification methylase